MDCDYGPKARYIVVAVDDLLVTSTGNLIEYDQVRSSILEGWCSIRDRSYLGAPGSALRRSLVRVTFGPSHARMLV